MDEEGVRVPAGTRSTAGARRVAGNGQPVVYERVRRHEDKHLPGVNIAVRIAHRGRQRRRRPCQPLAPPLWSGLGSGRRFVLASGLPNNVIDYGGPEHIFSCLSLIFIHLVVTAK